MSSNDLLNLIKELRSFPDLVDYLDARLNLPPDVRRVIGLEKMHYGYYLLNGETFDGCRSAADLEAALARNAEQLERGIAEKHRQDVFAGVIEQVSDALAVRAPDYGRRPRSRDGGEVRRRAESAELPHRSGEPV